MAQWSAEGHCVWGMKGKNRRGVNAQESARGAREEQEILRNSVWTHRVDTPRAPTAGEDAHITHPGDGTHDGVFTIHTLWSPGCLLSVGFHSRRRNQWKRREETAEGQLGQRQAGCPHSLVRQLRHPDPGTGLGGLPDMQVSASSSWMTRTLAKTEFPSLKTPLTHENLYVNVIIIGK